MTDAPRSARAAELFAEHLAASSDLAAELERLCTAHPELADELRSLAADWSRLEAVLERLGLRRLSRRRPGPATPPGEPPSALQLRAGDLLRELALAGPSRAYERRGEMARGGQGHVYRVWDRHLRRELAMKVLSARKHAHDPDDGSRAELRFLEEAHVTAQLDHPGVVPVHELGLDEDEHPFFTMKLVRGRTFTEVIDLARRGGEGWNPTRAAGVLLRVCEAMSYAHAKGVIHRDLKPGNVMVGRFGEVYVMDWGLARVLAEPDTRDLRIATTSTAVRGISSGERESDELRTRDGSVVGTPAYTSPEQARGEIERVDERSDVFALGAMLYHLLCGVPPHCHGPRRPSALEVLHRAGHEAPAPVRALEPAAPSELVAICERAMRRAPEQRYPTMAALADDLRAHLEGRVVHAHESGPLAELRKWVARNRALAAASLAALVLLAGGLVVSLVLGSEAARQRSNVLRLSAFRRLEELRERAAALWPAVPAHIGDYERWLADAAALVRELDETAAGPGHRALLLSLRQAGHARAGAELEAAERAHPLYDELSARRAEREALERAAAVRQGREQPEAAVLSQELRALPALALNNMAWDRVKPGRTLFGREHEALALVELALEKRGLRDDHALFQDTLARAYYANGRDEEALAASFQAVELAPAGEKAAYESRATQLENEVKAEPGATQRRVAALALQEQHLEEAILGDAGWIFEDEQSAWWHAQLARLVRELEALDDPDTGLAQGRWTDAGWGIARRLEVARRVRELTQESEDARRLWAEARTAIAAEPRYHDLDIAPQVGLLPLGPDARSGLWEFALVASGEIPRRRADGTLESGEESALVLVLLPGGSFLMGAQGASPSSPGYDPDARPGEGPPSTVALAPFFCSKLELTQAQWERLTGSNPAVYHHGMSYGGVPMQATNPIENVSWQESATTLARIDLELPTEAQWEYAARAGTTTPWSSGGARASLEGYANLADRAAQRTDESWPALADWRELDDGYPVHAPVGSYRPNAFGLHDVHGNVSEWTRDVYREYSYSFPARAGDGLRAGVEGPSASARGGCYLETAAVARSACRWSNVREGRGAFLGLRPVRALR